MASVAWQTEREPGPCSARVARLREHYFTFRPAICVERALAYTRSYRETEGLATGVRRAAALRRVCAEKSVTILADELIVGMPAFQPRGAVICPEISWRWLEAELDTIATREQDPYDISEEQKRVLRDEVFPYWRGRSMEEYYLANLPAETRRIAVDTGIIDIELKSQNGPGEFSPRLRQHPHEEGLRGHRRLRRGAHRRARRGRPRPLRPAALPGVGRRGRARPRTCWPAGTPARPSGWPRCLAGARRRAAAGRRDLPLGRRRRPAHLPRGPAAHLVRPGHAAARGERPRRTRPAAWTTTSTRSTRPTWRPVA